MKLIIPTANKNFAARRCHEITVERYTDGSVTVSQSSFTGRSRKVIYFTADQFKQVIEWIAFTS
jgi:hypothetical protein